VVFTVQSVPSVLDRLGIIIGPLLRLLPNATSFFIFSIVSISFRISLPSSLLMFLKQTVYIRLFQPYSKAK
jgi:hypothetical protein